MSQRVLEQKMQETQAAAQKAQQVMSQMNETMAKAKSGQGETQTLFDITSVDLEGVQQANSQMSANIADLIMDLDDHTTSFGDAFNSMRTQTASEKFIGFFAKKKSDSMRAERIRSASIDDKLQDLISKGEVITKILIEGKNVIQTSKTQVDENLERTFAQREDVIKTMEDVRRQLKELQPTLDDLEVRLASATDNVTRTQIATELTRQNGISNELASQEQSLIAESQTLESYIERNKIWADSLQNQLATQIVLISKLEIDTKQRSVLYDTLAKSLKTAEQQQTAHHVNRIGTKVDQQGEQMMAGVAAAANTQMVEMMESHEGQMVYSEEIRKAKHESDLKFARRFTEIVKKHDTAIYGE